MLSWLRSFKLNEYVSSNKTKQDNEKDLQLDARRHPHHKRRNGSYSYPLWIVACEYKGIIRMRLVQSFKSDRLATAIHQELTALFPGTTYTDRGCHDFDSFPLSSVPRKRDNTLL